MEGTSGSHSKNAWLVYYIGLLWALAASVARREHGPRWWEMPVKPIKRSKGRTVKHLGTKPDEFVGDRVGGSGVLRKKAGSS